MSLKRIRRRLSQTFTRFHDGSLTELAEHLTIEENGGIRENGELVEKQGKSPSRIIEFVTAASTRI